MIHVLYHANCNDGFGAAWAAWVHTQGEDAEFHPVSYQQEPPFAKLGKDNLIYIVDFSYDRERLMELASVHKHVTVLDHHKTAEDALTGEWPDKPQNLELHFEADKSGAVMTWEYFHGGYNRDDIPEILLYAQDRDLWRWELPDSKAINEALLILVPKEFKRWRTIDATWQATGKKQLMEDGYTALQVKFNYIADKAPRHHWQEIGGHKVPSINDYAYPSEMAEELCLRNPEA